MKVSGHHNKYKDIVEYSNIKYKKEKVYIDYKEVNINRYTLEEELILYEMGLVVDDVPRWS